MKIIIRILFIIFILLLASLALVRAFSPKKVENISYTSITTFTPISTPTLFLSPTIKKVTPNPTRIPKIPTPVDSTP